MPMGVPSTAAGVGALLDAILQMDRVQLDAPPPPEPVHKKTTPGLTLVKNGDPSEL